MYLQLYHDCLNLPYYITFNFPCGEKKKIAVCQNIFTYLYTGVFDFHFLNNIWYVLQLSEASLTWKTAMIILNHKEQFHYISSIAQLCNTVYLQTNATMLYLINEVTVIGFRILFWLKHTQWHFWIWNCIFQNVNFVTVPHRMHTDYCYFINIGGLIKSK